MKKRTNVNTERFNPVHFELENFLPYQLSLLTNTISQGIAESYRRNHEINVIEWRILAVLGRFPGLSASEVVELTAMDKVAISRAVKNLEEKGLLERRTDKADRRRHNLFITPQTGQPVLSEVVPLAQNYESTLLKTLTQRELNSFKSMMNKLLQSAIDLNAEQKEAEPKS